MVPRINFKGDCPPCWERLDRLDWNAGLAFVSYGVRIGVRVNNASVLERVAAILPPDSQLTDDPVVEGIYSLKVAEPSPNPSVRRYHMLYNGVGNIARTHDLDEALAMLESDMHLNVASKSKERLFVHAGVAAWNGCAIVIPGRSFSGKTSLVAALVNAGATYYSDEYAVFDSQGRVHPYAKTLSIRDQQGQPRERRSVESLGGQAGTEPLSVGTIVSARYEAGARWRPRPLSPGQTLLTLLDNTVQVREHPQMTLETPQKVAQNVGAVKSKRGEADQVAAWLLARP